MRESIVFILEDRVDLAIVCKEQFLLLLDILWQGVDKRHVELVLFFLFRGLPIDNLLLLVVLLFCIVALLFALALLLFSGFLLVL